MRYLAIFALAALIPFPSVSGSDETSANSARDRAVVLAALEDFAKWDGATFGPNRGVLAIDASARITLDSTIETVRAMAPKIRGTLSEELVSAFLQRNRKSSPSFELVDGSPWAKPKPPELDISMRPELPVGIKAVGSFTFPGFSKDGSLALLQIHHSWSMHGAIVTYVLARDPSTWRILARDQVVYP
jgi:hypothetical protein